MRVEKNEPYPFNLKQALKKAQALTQKYAKNQSLVALLKKMRKKEMS